MTATTAPTATTPRATSRASTTVRNLVASELAKLTTTRAARWLIVSAALLAALAISGVVAGGVAQDELATETGLRTVLGHGGLGALLVLVLGILASAGEFRHGTVVDTFLTEPRRTRVVGAKLLTGALVGVATGLLLALTTATTTGIWYAAKDVPLDLASAPVVRSLVGIVLWAALYAAIGVAFGSIIHTPAAAIVSIVVWLFVVETAISGLVSEVGRWLPATAAATLGYAPGFPGEPLLPQAGAGVVLLGWAGLATVGALLATTRRDVT